MAQKRPLILLKTFTTYLLMTCLVTACDSGGGGNSAIPGTSTSSGGIVDHMASAAVGGIAAGAGMAAGHAVANHAINKWQNRSRSGGMRSFRRR